MNTVEIARRIALITSVSRGLGRSRQRGGAGPTETAMLKRFTGSAEHKAGFISGVPQSQ